jgi:hypothetical protein
MRLAKTAGLVVVVLLVALIIFTQPESRRPPSAPESSPPARVSSVFYVNGNLCPEVMTHAECKERLGE